jgi:sepiapterin reductase
MAEDFWRSNVCCIVTGATRGYGKSVCLAFAKRFLEVHSGSSGTPDSTKKISFVLLGRNRPLLDELQNTLDKMSPNVHVIEVISGPLEDIKTVRTFEHALLTFGQVGPKYEHAILVHNAGNLNDPNRLVGSYTSDDSEYLCSYIECNFNSLVKLTGAFLRAFATSARRTLVNVSSLLALEPYKGLALYGAGKCKSTSLDLSRRVPPNDILICCSDCCRPPQPKQLVTRIFVRWRWKSRTFRC